MNGGVFNNSFKKWEEIFQKVPGRRTLSLYGSNTFFSAGSHIDPSSKVSGIGLANIGQANDKFCLSTYASIQDALDKAVQCLGGSTGGGGASATSSTGSTSAK
jgi:hypothetical protein